MNKVIKLIVLTSKEILLSVSEEVGAHVGDPDCKLINPLLFTSIDDMKPWKSDVTNQTEFMVRAEDILTIADPTGAVIDKYIELTS